MIQHRTPFGLLWWLVRGVPIEAMKYLKRMIIDIRLSPGCSEAGAFNPGVVELERRKEDVVRGYRSISDEGQDRCFRNVLDDDDRETVRNQTGQHSIPRKPSLCPPLSSFPFIPSSRRDTHTPNDKRNPLFMTRTTEAVRQSASRGRFGAKCAGRGSAGLSR